MKLKLVAEFNEPLTEIDMKLLGELLKLLKKYGYTKIEIPYGVTTNIERPQ